MQITFDSFNGKQEYQSLLVVGAENKWRETAYFTFYTPWGEGDERLYAGRYMADVHFKNKECECVFIFDFHKWTEETLKTALALERPRTAFDDQLEAMLLKALAERESGKSAFSIKIKKDK